MKYKLLACIVIIASIAGVAQASAPAPELKPYLKSETPYGAGSLSRLMFVAYDATLWTDANAWSYDAPFALSITYRMGFGREELVDRTLSEMADQASLESPDRQRYGQLLAELFVDVKKGDRFTAVYVPPAQVRFYHNGTSTGRFKDAELAKRFFDIWLSERTSEPSLRRDLLRHQAT